MSISGKGQPRGMGTDACGVVPTASAWLAYALAQQQPSCIPTLARRQALNRRQPDSPRCSRQPSLAASLPSLTSLTDKSIADSPTALTAPDSPRLPTASPLPTVLASLARPGPPQLPPAPAPLAHRQPSSLSCLEALLTVS
jgi:hypothetical protein